MEPVVLQWDAKITIKKKGFWLYDKDQKIYVPSKFDKMFKDYLSQTR